MTGRAALALGLVGSLLGASSARADTLFVDQPGVLGEQACAGGGCWTNYAAMFDVNGDGNLDLVLANCGGFFADPATAEPLVIYEGDGAGHFVDASAATVGGFVGRVRQITFGDVDGDGRPDMYAPDANGGPDALFMGKADGTFVDEASTRLGGLASHAGAARFVDVDLDGNLDLLVAGGYAAKDPAQAAHLYLNDGTGHFAEAPAGSVPASLAVNVDDIDVFDADGDFDLDVLLDVHDGNDILWINDGTGKFVDASSNLPPLPPKQFHYDPGVADVDGDGDLDVVIDNVGPNLTEMLLLNDGAGHFTDATSQITGNVDGADDNGAAFVDYDGDGDLDLVVPSLSSKGERLFANDGKGHFTAVPSAFSPIVDGTLWIDFGDVNGDGRLDAITGEGEATELDHVYFGADGVSVDARAPVVRGSSITTLGDGSRRIAFAVVDDAVTDTGPRLQRAWVAAGDTEVDAKFIGGDLFLATLPAGTNPVRTCAVDMRGNASSPDCAPTSSTSSTGSTSSATGASTASSSTGAGVGGGGGSDGGGSGCACSASSGSARRLAVLGVGIAWITFVRRSRRRRVS